MSGGGVSRVRLSPTSFEGKTPFSASQRLAVAPKLRRSLTVPQSKKRRRSTGPAAPVRGAKERVQRPLPEFLLGAAPDVPQPELTFVKSGKYPTRPHRKPKPNNFRPLNEDLPHRVTTSKLDPGNLDFKSKHLDIVGTRCTVSTRSSRDMKTRMDTYKPAEPRWDPGLILPKLPWPPKLASYTRHGRRRELYSAFVERVEEKLSLSWNER